MTQSSAWRNADYYEQSSSSQQPLHAMSLTFWRAIGSASISQDGKVDFKKIGRDPNLFYNKKAIHKTERRQHESVWNGVLRWVHVWGNLWESVSLTSESRCLGSPMAQFTAERITAPDHLSRVIKVVLPNSIITNVEENRQEEMVKKTKRSTSLRILFLIVS